MKSRLLEILACPLCSGALRIEGASEASEAEILRGKLRCSACGASFPISAGIPRFLPSQARDEEPPLAGLEEDAGATRTAQTFGYEFSHFSQPSREINRLLFFRKTGIDPQIYHFVKYSSNGDSIAGTEPGYRPDGDLLRGKRVLDLGCGMGRFADVVREYAGEVVGLDISGAVDVARAQYGGHQNVHFVQGDILHPPFAPASFDFVYSLGVLHHTRRTSLAFQRAAALCAPGGHLAVWVYPPSYWNGVLRGTVAKALRLVTRRLSPGQIHVFCSLLRPLGILQMRMARRKWTKILGSPLFLVPVPRDQEGQKVDLGVIYDYYSPHYIWTHTAEEVVRWYRECGFEEVRALPVDTAVLGRKRPVSQPVPRSSS